MLSWSFVADVKGNVSNFIIFGHKFLRHLLNKLRRCQRGQVATKNIDSELQSWTHQNKINQ